MNYSYKIGLNQLGTVYTSYFCARGRVTLGSSFRSNLGYLVALPSERVSLGGIGIQIHLQMQRYKCRHITRILV